MLQAAQTPFKHIIQPGYVASHSTHLSPPYANEYPGAQEKHVVALQDEQYSKVDVQFKHRPAVYVYPVMQSHCLVTVLKTLLARASQVAHMLYQVLQVMQVV